MPSAVELVAHHSGVILAAVATIEAQLRVAQQKPLNTLSLDEFREMFYRDVGAEQNEEWNVRIASVYSILVRYQKVVPSYG